MFNKTVWVHGETIAENFLKNKGYKIIDKNCKIGGSELDIVAILPKKQQKTDLITNFKQQLKDDEFKDKYEKKFNKIKLLNQIKVLKDIIVFVEVKARFSKKFGNPYEAVDEFKQHNLARGCTAYLLKNNKKNLPSRIDVISVVDDEIIHIENAFEVRGY